jgi:proline iminopeptidase
MKFYHQYLIPFTILILTSLGFASCSPSNSEDERNNQLLLTYLANPATTGTVISADGTPIYYKKIGSGTPVVVLHGGPGLDHNYLVAPLVATIGTGKQLIFFDQRGTGYSGGNFSQINSSFINKDKFLQDLEAIRTQLNLGEEIHILGHSWGGLYAMLYATDSKYKSHVKSLALVSSSGAQHSYYGAFLTKLIGVATMPAAATITSLSQPIDPSKPNYKPSMLALKEYYRFLFKFYFKDYSSPGDPNGSSANLEKLGLELSTEKTIRNGYAVSDLINASLRIDTAAYLGGGPGSSTLDITGLNQLGSVTVPILIVHGAEDVIPKEYTLGANLKSVDLNIGTPADKKKKVEIANSGHFPFIEQPEEFRTAFEGFY